MKKRFLILALVLCLCLSLLPAGVLADGESFAGKTVILYTSNIRGDIDEYLQVSKAKKAYEAAGADVILVDSGNFLQGTKYSAYHNGENIVPLLDTVGYDAVAIGTHEFDFHDGSIGASAHANEGQNVYQQCDSIGTMLSQAKVKAVSNMTGNNAVFPSGSYSAGVVVQHDAGLKVGVYGITDPSTAAMINENYVSDFSFSSNTAVPGNLSSGAADIVVCLSNAGVGTSVAGADIVIDAPSSGTFSWGAYIVDNSTKAIEAVASSSLLTGTADSAVTNAVTNAKNAAGTAFGTRVAASSVVMQGTNEANRAGETNTGDLVTDALLWYAKSGNLADKIDDPYYSASVLSSSNGGILVDDDHIVALWNGGNLRGFMYPGDVTVTDLRRILPYPNTISVVYMTGAQLLEQLEACSEGLPYTDASYSACASFMQAAGIDYTVNTDAEIDGTGKTYGSTPVYGSNGYEIIKTVNRVTINSVNGKPFDSKALYAVVTHDKNVNNGMDASYVMYAICHGADAVKGYTGTIDSAQTDKTVVTKYDCYNVVMDYIQNELGGTVGSEYAAADSRIHLTAGGASNPSGPSGSGSSSESTEPDKDAGTGYSDVKENDWYYKSVTKAVELGLMSGTGNGKFSPDALTSRAMLVTILYRMAGSPKVSSTTKFTDLAQDWYKNAVAWAYEKGIVSGVGTDRFGPDGTLTREQMATMFYNFAKSMGKDVSASADISGYTDSTGISPYAQAAMKWAVSTGIISGLSGSVLSPGGSATRAQVATVAVSYGT